MTLPDVSLASRIGLRELAARRDGPDWIVGREATGEFVSVPAEAMTFLDVLREGGTVADAKRRTQLAHGEDIDALDFVGDLAGLGFVAAVDGEPVTREPPRPPSLPWLAPHHVAWLFRAPVLVLAGAFICAGVTVAAASGGLPSYSAFFALREPGLNLVLVAVVCMAVMALHEFFHLAAARAARVHGWLAWSTRLCFLVAQTSVPGLWLAGRTVRLRVFLAGMASDLVIFSGCSIGRALTAPASLAHHVFGQICLLTLLGVIEEFAFCLRTDVFLVVQELTGCKDLFGDATAYLRYLVGRHTGAGAAGPSPLAALPAHERRPVRLYAGVMAAGCAVLLALFGWYGIPVDVGSYVRAAHELAHGLASSQADAVVDATGLIAVTLVFHFLLIRTLLRGYGPRIRRWWLLREGAGEAELRQDAVVQEAADDRDAVAGQGEHDEPVRAVDARPRVEQVGAEGGLAVRAGGDQPELPPVAEPDDRQEVMGGGPALVLQRERRHP
jgi:putative peptide zinc metalloprotease protein